MPRLALVACLIFTDSVPIFCSFALAYSLHCITAAASSSLAESMGLAPACTIESAFTAALRDPTLPPTGPATQPTVSSSEEYSKNDSKSSLEE